MASSASGVFIFVKLLKHTVDAKHIVHTVISAMSLCDVQCLVHRENYAKMLWLQLLLLCFYNSKHDLPRTLDLSYSIL